jgi:hypothetical protein
MPKFFNLSEATKLDLKDVRYTDELAPDHIIIDEASHKNLDHGHGASNQIDDIDCACGPNR